MIAHGLKVTVKCGEILCRLHTLISFIVFFNFLPVLEMNEQHSKAFALFFLQMLVVHFVCPAHYTNILIVAACQNLKSLMNNDVVYHKISNAIQQDAATDGNHPAVIIECAKQKKQHAGYSKNDGSRI